MMRIRTRRRASTTYPEKVLAESRDLVSARRPLDAIDLLTKANRVQRDGLIERRLVELRLGAFRSLRWPDLPPAWPEHVPDLFPGVLIPEIASRDLTVDRVRSGIRNHGSIIVRGLVGRAQVERLIGDIDSTLTAFDAQASGAPADAVGDYYVPTEIYRVRDADRTRKRKGGNILAVESPPTLFDLIEIFKDVGIGRLASEFLGERPALLARKVTLRRMAPQSTGGWHQDGAFMGADIRSLNVWLALTHCGDDSPSLDVAGRRFEEIVQTGDGATKEWSVTAERAEHAGAGTIVRPIFEPGDALVFDQLCLHRTGRDDTMHKPRYAIETWFFAPSTYAAMLHPTRDGYPPDDQVPLIF